tara:strand:- start:324 stop:497 length:174 start_codon:yes stop_codon:yes gene_type:complete
MKKIILIINLIVKTIVELVLVCTIGLLTGLIVFIGAYVYKSIKQAVIDYKAYLRSDC